MIICDNNVFTFFFYATLQEPEAHFCSKFKNELRTKAASAP